MPGRNAVPVDLQVLDGNPNRLTKAEIKRRKESEISLGGVKLTAPSFITKDKVAYTKWKKLVQEYGEAADKGVELVTSTDIGILARYCKTFSEYVSLLKRRNSISDIDYLDTGALDLLEEDNPEKAAKDLYNKMNYIISTEGLIKIDTAINKKLDMLIKMEDRLFLTPLAKIKNIPKAPQKSEEVDPIESNFGAI